MKYRQEPPFAVQIELTEGCPLRCTFCGLNGIRTPTEHNYKFMELHTLKVCVKQMLRAGWNPRIELAMHGEPTMNPQYIKAVALIRKLAPKWSIMMTSNGAGLLRSPGPLENVQTLFDAGLNVLALDDYQNVKFVTKIRQAVKGNLSEDIKVYEYPDEDEGNPHRPRGPKVKMLSFIEDISKADKGTHATLNNHAGAGAPPNDKGQGKRCAKPFRELAIRWDGNVAICCNEWRGRYKCGNIVEDGLDRVWNGPEMQAARKKLYHGMRDFGECKGCDAISYRVGLLPDKMGKATLPKPDERDERIIAKALSGDPYTKPVLRPWEIKPVRIRLGDKS